MKMSLASFAAALLLLNVAQPASPTVASDSEPPELRRLAGSYTLVGTQADNVAAIQAAIERAISGMGGLKKNIARKRLDAVNKAVVRLKISSVRNQVTVGMDNYVVTAPLDGGTARVKTPSGDMADASFKLDKATLIQDLIQTKGRRENSFRFNSKGELVMHVLESSPKLSAPVSYSLRYTRAGQ